MITRRSRAGPAFAYSGYVVVVLIEHLRELEIELPVSRDPAVQQLVVRLACTERSGATAAAGQNASLVIRRFEN